MQFTCLEMLWDRYLNIKELTIQKNEQSRKRKLPLKNSEAGIDGIYPSIKTTKDVYLLIFDDMDKEILWDLDIFSGGSNT